MTLILNEILLQKGLVDTFQIAAADRRITFGKKILPPRRKLFAIPYLNATVSYFGLAAFQKQNKWIYFSELIPQIIKSNSNCKSLEDFACLLSETLNDTIPLAYRKGNISGFHLAGYNIDGLPEFWHFSNIPGMNGYNYNPPVEKYGIPTSDFLKRDALQIGYDGVDPLSAQSGGKQTYRNGAIITHVMAWDQIDIAMSAIMSYPNFKPLKTIEDYADYVKFKFEIISHIYKNWAEKKVVSRPIDVIIIKKQGLFEKKKGKWSKI